MCQIEGCWMSPGLTRQQRIWKELPSPMYLEWTVQAECVKSACHVEQECTGGVSQRSVLPPKYKTLVLAPFYLIPEFRL